MKELVSFELHEIKHFAMTNTFASLNKFSINLILLVGWGKANEMLGKKIPSLPQAWLFDYD